jgi:hypothetical protein
LGSRRAIIIDPADDLETSAVNALLKSLEEPPAGTYFLLVTHRLGRLLPTIRSRCRILRFAAERWGGGWHSEGAGPAGRWTGAGRGRSRRAGFARRGTGFRA